MKAAWLRILGLLFALLVLPLAARATITCTSITSPGASINYVNNTTMSVQTYIAVTCTRSSTGDPTSVSYSVKADNGGNPTGINNRATLTGGATLRYDFYTSASCGTQWKGNTTVGDTINWGSSTGPITKQTSYWACVVSAQTATTSGTYADMVNFSLTYNNNVTLSGTAPVSIYAPALCTVSKAPGNIGLAYAAFGPQVSNSTTIGVTCTSGMPFTLATDVPEAVLNGLRYTLGVTGPPTNGTGGVLTYTITATIPALQAGTCPTANCTATRPHTLTISY